MVVFKKRLFWRVQAWVGKQSKGFTKPFLAEESRITFKPQASHHRTRWREGAGREADHGDRSCLQLVLEVLWQLDGILPLDQKSEARCTNIRKGPERVVSSSARVSPSRRGFLQSVPPDSTVSFLR